MALSFEQISPLVFGDAQANRRIFYGQFRLVEFLKTDGVDIYIDILRVVYKVILHLSFKFILDIELEVLNRLACEEMTLQYLHLIVNTITIGDESDVLHVGQHLVASSASAVLVIFDKHLA